MKDSVGKWYKDKANDLNVIPPHEAWKNIENKLETWPEYWYQSNFDDLQSEDVDVGWNHLAQQLEVQRNQRSGYRNFVFRTASIAVFLVMIPLFLANVVNYQVPLFNGDIAIAPSNDASAPVHTQPDDFSTLNAASNVVASNSQRTALSTPTSINPSVNARNVSFPSQKLSALKTVATDLETRALPKLHLPSFDTKPSEIIASTLPTVEKSKTRDNDAASSSRKWFVGTTLLGGNSELINPLSYREDVVVGNTFNFAYGATVSRRFEKNAVSADLIFNDLKAQSAMLHSENVSTALNGITLGIQYERWIPTRNEHSRWRPEFYFGSGLFGSYLQNARVESDITDSFFSTFTYKRMDFGVVFTAGAAIQLTKRLQFSAAARVQSGVMNLFGGVEKVPSDYFETQSRVIGLQTRLSYTF